MLSLSQPDGCWSMGQIRLDETLFCLDCELIFAGTARCLRCGDEMVWSLAQWLSRPPATEPAAAGMR